MSAIPSHPNIWRHALPIAVVLATVSVLSMSCDDDDDDGGPPSYLPGLSEEALQLASDYAPVLYLARQNDSCDATIDTDPYDPTDVGVFLDKPDVRLLTNNELPTRDRVRLSQPSEADLYNSGERDYLDVLEESHPRNPDDRCDFETAYLRAGGTPTVYARVVYGNDKIALQYWFFYYFNDWISRHEGDFEMIQLLFSRASASEIVAQRTPPDWIAYSQHTGGRRYRWDDVQQEPAGSTHPVVYVASGSHANYVEPGFWHTEIKAWFDGCDLAAAGDDARRLDPTEEDYQILLLSSPAAATDLFAWSSFAGHWGELSLPGFSGPTGPLQHSQGQDPWNWNEGLSAKPLGTCTLRADGQRSASAGSQLLADARTIAQDVTVLAGDVVRFLTTWGGSEVSLTLESPSGTIIGPDDTSEYAVHDKGDNYEVYLLEEAEPGRWRMLIEGTDLPNGPETVTWEAYDIPPPCDGVGERPDADSDLDGIANREESSNNLDPCDWDSDGDGVSDGATRANALDVAVYDLTLEAH